MSGDGRGNRANRPVTGRASSARTQGAAATRLAERSELELLKWAVHEPDALVPWPSASLFAIPVYAEAFNCLASTADFPSAMRLAAERGEEQVISLLHRVAVEEPQGEAQDVLIQFVRLATTRAVDDLCQLPADHPDAAIVATLKHLAEALSDPVDPEVRARALDQLVPWLDTWRNRLNP